MEETITQNMKKPQEVLAEFFSECSYGDLVPHDKIESIIGFSRTLNQHKYNSVVQSAKRILLNQYGRALDCVKNQGYRLILPGDYVSKSMKHYKRGFTEIKKGKDTLDYAPVNDMTTEEREAYVRVHDKSVILQASMEGALCELKVLGTKTHPFLAQNNNKA